MYLLREFFNNRWVALFGFILVIASSMSLYLSPQNRLWVLLPSIVFWGFSTYLKRTRIFGLSDAGALSIFVLTAAVGVWAAYDETAAWNKFFLIIAAVLFFLAIAEQPEENLKILAGFWFIAGVGIAIYFLLTFDFGTQVVKFRFVHQLGLFWMKIRPISIHLPSIPPNDTAGISIIMSAYGFYFLGQFGTANRIEYLRRLSVIAGLGIAGLAVVTASSRGAVLALTGATGVWLLWRILLRWQPLLVRQKLLSLFPGFVAVSVFALGVIVLIIPFRFLGSTFGVAGNVAISRMELVRSGWWILRDFPFTGGGLNSFPGLYSQYVLVIPYYSIRNSHNIFLDVALEQGIFGGISFVFIYLATVRQLVGAWRKNLSSEMQMLYFAACLSLFTAILHGMVDDYIYGGRGTVLALIPAGMAIFVSRLSYDNKGQTISEGQANHSKPGWFRTESSVLWLRGSIFVVSMAVLLAFMWNSMIAQWYANIGSVKMAKVDLVNYPSNRWYDGDQADRWLSAENDFRRALAYQANNMTANHRLGLISLMTRDFESASDYLLRAYERNSSNRGVIKNLGYSYVWLGETDKAQSFLERIPEAKSELDVYVWWWGTQKRGDLAEQADLMLSRLDPLPSPQ